MRFEALVSELSRVPTRLSPFLGIRTQPKALSDLRVPMVGHVPGEPTGVPCCEQPEPSWADAWVHALEASPLRRALIEQQAVLDQNLAAWGGILEACCGRLFWAMLSL